MKVLKDTISVIIFEKGGLDQLGNFVGAGTGHTALQIGDDVYSKEGGVGFKHMSFLNYAKDNIKRGGSVLIATLVRTDDGNLRKMVENNSKVWLPTHTCNTHTVDVLNEYCKTKMSNSTDPQTLFEELYRAGLLLDSRKVKVERMNVLRHSLH